MERWWLCVDAAPWLRFRDMNSAEGVLWPMSGVAVDPVALMHVPFDCALSSCDAPDTFDGCDGCGACSLNGCEGGIVRTLGHTLDSCDACGAFDGCDGCDAPIVLSFAA